MCFVAKHESDNIYVRGFSPTHAQPIVTTNIDKAKHFSSPEAFERYVSRNMASAGNWKEFRLVNGTHD